MNTARDPLRILQLLPALEEGGVERGVVELNREFVRRGHESHVASRGGRLVAAIQQEGGRHHPIDIASKNPFTAPWRAVQLRRLFGRIRPSLIHARSRVPAWLAVLANRRPRLPFVTTVHGLNRVNPYSRVMTLGDQVICISELVAAYVQRHYGVPAARITVIQRGVDLGFFDPARVDHAFIEAFRRDHGLEGRRVALSVGRITWLKDYESFIRAVALARERRPELVGVIAGGATPDKQRYFESLQALCRELRVADHIRFVGSQTRMPELYALADVVVNASLKMGNVGRTVAEALAMNTPVLATTLPGLRNLVQDGLNGFIIETRHPKDLARRMLQALELPREGIRRTIPPEYTLDHMVEQTLAVYRRVLAGASSS